MTEGIFAVLYDMCQLWAIHVVKKEIFLHLYLLKLF